jgi:hypothetical protein
VSNKNVEINFENYQNRSYETETQMDEHISICDAISYPSQHSAAFLQDLIIFFAIERRALAMFRFQYISLPVSKALKSVR